MDCSPHLVHFSFFLCIHKSWHWIFHNTHCHHYYIMLLLSVLIQEMTQMTMTSWLRLFCRGGSLDQRLQEARKMKHKADNMVGDKFVGLWWRWSWVVKGCCVCCVHEEGKNGWSGVSGWGGTPINHNNDFTSSWHVLLWTLSSRQAQFLPSDAPIPMPVKYFFLTLLFLPLPFATSLPSWPAFHILHTFDTSPLLLSSSVLSNV